MPERYVDAILKYLSDRDYRPAKPKQVARRMGISQGEYGTFREAVKQLRASGRVVLGERDALTLPPIPKRVVGFYRANRKGFGFVVPETPNAHGDLYVPAEASGGAINGDLVAARVRPGGRRAGQMMYSGQIVQIIERGEHRFVGELANSEGAWFVVPDGGRLFTPVVVRDLPPATKAGTKVVVEIVKYPEPGSLPVGVITETLGKPGRLDVETAAMIRAHGLTEEFNPAALDDARAAVEAFVPAALDGREDLTSLDVITIDPPDARDFDDAISLTRSGDGGFTLGVHIADVAHFVAEGGDLDADARKRSTSAYFPRRVVPMLPEILSNGVCSLQEGQARYAKSVFITYDAKARRVSSRLCESVIRSNKRLTYVEAQAAIDGKGTSCPRRIAALLKDLAALARLIETRRKRDGMIQLDLGEVEFVLDGDGKLVDVKPADDSYTHTMIEMFMVEANEAVAEKLDAAGRSFLRRIHPAPDAVSSKHLGSILRAAGHKIPPDLTPKDIQDLLAAVKGRPEGYAVNLALLRTFQQAEYSPMRIGHYALGSKHYCHFTSPIRRYPDLTIHRLVRDYCRSRLGELPPDDMSALTQLGETCSAAARRAEAAENELRDVVVIGFLAEKIGESFEGVVTGVTNFGIFVQLRKFMVDGLVRLEELGDDWWEVTPRLAQVRGERTGKTYRIGDLMDVRVVRANPAQRMLDLVPSAGRARDAGAEAKAAQQAKAGQQARTGKTPSEPPPAERGRARKSANSARPAKKRAGGQGTEKRHTGPPGQQPPRTAKRKKRR